MVRNIADANKRLDKGHMNTHTNFCYTLSPLFLQVKCYHKSDVTSEREVIFRLQFHTGAVQGYNLMFEKEDMETANKGIHTHTHKHTWKGLENVSAGLHFPL